MLTSELVQEFKIYCDAYGWTFDNHSSEFTFQLRLGWYLNAIFKNQYMIDFETNIRKFNISETIKTEIDIYLQDRHDKTNHAIEIKYIKNEPGYDIGLYEMCKDIKFLEQLQHNYNFSTTYSLAFTSNQSVYTPSKNGKYKSKGERRDFYNCFRENRCISGKIFRNETQCLIFDKKYHLDWFDFTPGIKACIVKV